MFNWLTQFPDSSLRFLSLAQGESDIFPVYMWLYGYVDESMALTIQICNII